MSPELEKEILEKYPKLFPVLDKELNCEIYYGFYCGDGWYHIIDVLCKNIQFYIDYKVQDLEEEDAEYYQVIVQEVKEKYGSLRFHVINADEYISGMITMAESISTKVCEYCGSKAEITTKGWIKHLCNSCNNKEKK